MYLLPVLASNSMPPTDIEPCLDNSGVVCYKQKRATRKITGFSRWSEAWTRFSKFMVKYVGSHVQEHMADYYLFMLKSEKKYAWSALSVFDYRHQIFLTWKFDIDKRAKSICRNIALLRRIRKYLPHQTRITFFKSYIQPHIDYYNTV